MSDSLGFTDNGIIELPDNISFNSDGYLRCNTVVDGVDDTFDKSTPENDDTKPLNKPDILYWYGVTSDHRIRQLGLELNNDRDIVINENTTWTSKYYKTIKDKEKYWTIDDFCIRTAPNEGAFGVINFKSKNVKDGELPEYFSIIVGSEVLTKYYNKHQYD